MSQWPDLDNVSRGIIEVVGDDAAGNKIIVISACRFPCNKVSKLFKNLCVSMHILLVTR